MLAIWSLVPQPFLNQLEHLEVHGSCIAEAWLGEFWALLSLLVCEMSAAFLFLKYFYYFRVTILYHCIGFYSFELLSYTQIHWPLQYCCKVGVKSRTWFYPITNSCVNLLSFTDAGRKQHSWVREQRMHYLWLYNCHAHQHICVAFLLFLVPWEWCEKAQMDSAHAVGFCHSWVTLSLGDWPNL